MPVAETLKAPCPRPNLPQLPNAIPAQRDAAVDQVLRPVMAFAVKEEAAVSVCEARKDAAVAVIEAHNQLVTDLAKPQRPWWKFWGR